MLAKLLILSAVAAATSALAPATGLSPGYVSSAYALGSQAEHTVRGYGGLSSISKQAKVINSPYATVRKTDIRYTNDATYAGHPAISGLAYATPTTYAHGYGAPAFAHAPAAYHHAPAFTHGYQTTIGASPAFAHHGYHAPAGAITYAHPGYAAAPAAVHHAPIGYAAHPHHQALPAVAKGVAVPAGLGVAYSSAPAVATASFNGYGVHYGY